MDPVSLLGLFLAFAAILGGQYLEGGHIGSILQPAAAVIVLGGTLGATLLSHTRADVTKAMRDARDVFRRPRSRQQEILRDFAIFAEQARKDGLVSLEEHVARHSDPFFRSALKQVIDGTQDPLLREILETEVDVHEQETESGIRVYEVAGGYAPTMGILGAVLGLVHVMENLSDPERLGAGIAVAFVATIYGIGLANLVLLPIAGKLRRLAAGQRAHMEMIVEGAIVLQSGQSPRAVRDRLEAFLVTS